MNEILDDDFLKKKIYSEKAIWSGTFLGGPLVATYLISHNFKVFNEYQKSNLTWIIGIISTLIIFGGIFLIPENINIPNQLIPLIYTSIAFALVKYFQKINIENHINNGGEIYSIWRSLGIALIGILTILIPILLMAIWDISTKL